MRAIIFDRTLKFKKYYPEPRPLKGEALIKTTLAGICNTDIEITKGYMNFRGILGHEFVGIVVDVNGETEEKKFWLKKRVVGEINCGCGRCDYCRSGNKNHCPRRKVLGILNKDGVMADYFTLPLSNLHLLPDNVSDEEGVFVEPLAACFRILEQIKVEKGMKVIIFGDGKLGILTALLLTRFVDHLTVIGKHEEKMKILRERGIKTTLLKNYKPRRLYDISIDATGNPEGINYAANAVKPEGTVIVKTTTASSSPINLSLFVINEIKIIGSRCGPFRESINALERKIIDVKPLISGIFNPHEALYAFKKARENNSLKVLISFR